VILTDHQYTILTLLRAHKYEEDVRCAVKEKYPFTHAANCTIDSIVTAPAEVGSLIEKVDKKREEM